MALSRRRGRRPGPALCAISRPPSGRQTGPASSPGAAGLPATSESDAPPQARLVALINALAAGGGDLTLVLDDYHLVRAFAVHDLVAFLLAHQPPGLHLVVGTREDPPLPLARLRARDQMTEIRERDLRFTAAEAIAFLGQDHAPEPIRRDLRRPGRPGRGLGHRPAVGGPRHAPRRPAGRRRHAPRLVRP